MPQAVESKKVHFVHRLLRLPAFDGHAIGGDENTGTVATETAVNKNPFLRMVAKEREKLRDLFVARRLPSADGNVHKTHSERFRLPAFPLHFIPIVAAQIHYGSDSEILELQESLGVRLRAAEERVADFSAVRNAGELESLAMIGGHGRSRVHCRSLGSRPGIRNRDGSEKEKAKYCAHSELDAKSLARVYAAKLAAGGTRFEAMAPLDIDT